MTEKQRIIISSAAIVIGLGLGLASLIINMYTLHNLMVMARLQGM